MPFAGQRHAYNCPETPRGATVDSLFFILDEAAYGYSVTRKNRWYESEFKRGPVTLPSCEISKTLVTNAQYAAFVAATGHRVPEVDAATWKGYGLIHPYKRTRRHAWSAGEPPKGRVRIPSCWSAMRMPKPMRHGLAR